MRGEHEARRAIAEGYARAAARDRWHRLWSRVMDSRWLAGIALVAGAYVVWNELTYKGSSTLTPILLVLGIGLMALAAAHLVRHRTP